MSKAGLRAPLVVIVAVAALALVGCAGNPGTPGDPVPRPTSSGPDGSAPPDPIPGGGLGGAGFVGTWGTDGERQPHLVLQADGAFAGSDGCNRLSGRWEYDDDDRSIEFEGTAMTLMACNGVDQSLNRLDSATLDGDTLTVRDDDDRIVATLPRTA